MAIEQMKGVCECGASNFIGDKWVSMAERLNGETCMFHANGRCWRCGMVLTAEGRAVYPTTLPADATGAAVTSEATADLIKRVGWYFAGDDPGLGAEIVAALQQAADPQAMVPRAALELACEPNYVSCDDCPVQFATCGEPEDGRYRVTPDEDCLRCRVAHFLALAAGETAQEDADATE